ASCRAPAQTIRAKKRKVASSTYSRIVTMLSLCSATTCDIRDTRPTASAHCINISVWFMVVCPAKRPVLPQAGPPPVCPACHVRRCPLLYAGYLRYAFAGQAYSSPYNTPAIVLFSDPLTGLPDPDACPFR